MHWSWKLLVSAAVFLLLSTAAFSQNAAKARLTVRIDQIVSRDFPDITAYASVENEAGDEAAALAPGLFRFRIDSEDAVGRWSVTPFSLREEPVDYSVLFSAGGVMEGEPLEFQKTALLQFIDNLKDEDTLSVYTIGEDAAALFEEQKKADIDSALVSGAAISPGQPRLYDSLIGVLRKAARRTVRRKAAIVISDGRDQGSRFTKEQLGAVLAESELPVYAIGMRVLSTQSLSVLNEIADSSGGAYIYARSLREIPDSMRKIYRKITRGYVISMTVKSPAADDLPHNLEIAVIETDAEGRGSKTFIAVKNPLPRWLKWAVLGAVVFFLVVCIVTHLIVRIQKRKRMGITRRRCPLCKTRMKDSWDDCPFCKYLPPKKRKNQEAAR
ncbi:MAG: VWA domain-containing protein [Spirochaetaceae bacterium]|nr:VWA domain-containing protein [Spirochaetaceae bacterium]